MSPRSDDPGRGRARPSSNGSGKRTRKSPSKRGRASRRAPAASVEPTAVDELAVAGETRAHTEWELSNEAVESALRTGEFAGLLEDYFGPGNYEELRQLQREASARSVRGGPRVLILPGIMGSTIGRKRAIAIFDDVLWIDPLDIAQGKLARLALAKSKNDFAPLGVVLLYYLKLKLRLRSAGYDADFHPFDWRLSIAELGRGLAERLKKEKKPQDVSLVAHSMGGLVSRWALGKGGAKCKRLIMLGTPNFGSYAPVMALRAAYPVVRKVAGLDLRHSPEQLARDVFSTFAGLTQMFPARDRLKEVDVYDLDAWPPDDLRPRQELLDTIKAVHGDMIDGGDNVFLIAGVDQETPVGVRTAEEQRDGQAVRAFAYEFSTDGDGTVPLDLCRLPGAKKTYYIAEQHGSMANNRLLTKAVLDLLDRGETTLLPDSYTPPVRRAEPRVRHERDLRIDPYEGRRGTLSQRELRHLLDEFASPDARDELAPAVAAAPAAVAPRLPEPPQEPGYRHRFERVVVGRRRQHRIDLRFAFGSITESDARALALGVFRDVAPSGAASALDARLGGAITDFTRRRMFSGNVGEVFMLPTGRNDLRADLIAFVGLGAFDRFNDEVLQTAAENVIRTFITTRVEEFATVLFGGASGETPANGLRNLLTGFFRGLCDADRDHQFRRLVVCENNADRYVQLKEELYRLSSTALCQDVEITFDEVQLPQPAAAAPLPRRLQRREDPIYLIVRQEASRKGEFDVRSSLLTSGSKATVITGVRTVEDRPFTELLERTVSDRTEDFSEVGVQLGEQLLAEEILRVMPRFREQHHLVLVHDAPLSRIPWETLALPSENGDGLWFPAGERGLSHRYAADNLSVAKWLEQRLQDDVLNLLLVVDPTRDLQGARVEGKRVQDLFRNRPGCVVEQLYQSDATRPALLAAFGSGKYDIIHYAGHAFFDPRKPERSGILCHNQVPLTGADLAGLGNLPTLVFFNACESARVRTLPQSQRRKADEQKKIRAKRLEHVNRAVSLAEAFMRGGVANFIGTYWPVGDLAAEVFAREFYGAVLNGTTVGVALQTGRSKVRDEQSKDWANYIFYGNPDFVLKDLEPGLRGRAVEIDIEAGSDV